MSLSKQEFSNYIKHFSYRELFNDLGWNNDKTTQYIAVDDTTYALNAVAEKCGLKILTCKVDTLPLTPTRKKIDAQIRRLFYYFILICIDNSGNQKWIIPIKKPEGRDLVTIDYESHQAPEFLYQKVSQLTFSLEQEEHLTIVDVSKLINDTFIVNSEKITKQFYDKFKKEHTAFISFITGISEKVNQEWYASLMLNRLMFCYFIQKKGFLDNNRHYLRDKLNECKEKNEKIKFYSFYRDFLLVLFHKGLNEPPQSREAGIEIGRIPYLNGGLFDEHELEKNNPNIEIDDRAFERLFDFFDQYQWHLDTRQTATGKDINPDVIGYIFEKYINDRAKMGAYYTKEDITDYISKNCIIPWLFDETFRTLRQAQGAKTAELAAAEIWQKVKESGDRYIYDAVKKGVSLTLPEEIEIGVNTTLPDLISRRKEWNKSAPPEYALPTEIWREVVDRRNRYTEVKDKIEKGAVQQINDFITFNLDIRLFAQEMVDNTDDPEFLKHFYKALSGVTILDPTCGSGAFLFAAMNILEPLYKGCIDRMESFVATAPKGKYRFFEDTLSEVKSPEHSNLDYFIYKSIILHNLYGVDIMKEAVEIAKLRLFLKLVATVEADYRKPNLGLEPLPDIDFNIRTGNTLVGFASLNEAIQAINEKDQTGQLGLVFGDEISIVNGIKNKADDLAIIYKSFKKAQEVDKVEDHKKAKEKLIKYQSDLNEILNEYLAFGYGIDKKQDKMNYRDFLESHQPFHWFAEFYEIVHENKGFDVIIGNPPYVEYSKASKEYTVKDYVVQKSGNLYGLLSERAKRLIANSGYLSFIVPISIICTQRMQSLQNLVFNSNTVWLSNYGERPSKLFTGAEVLITIFIISPKKDLATINTSTFIKWRANERSILFEKLSYTQIQLKTKEYVIPKIGSQIENSILQRVSKTNKSLAFDLLNSGTHRIFYRIGGGRYWKIFTDFSPKFVLNGENAVSSRENYLFSKNEVEKKAIISILSSSIFYWYFVLTTNCRDLNPSDLKEFPISISDLGFSDLKMLSKLADLLMTDYKVHSELKEKVSGKTGKIIYQEFYPKKSKSIIDEIDTVLAKHYGFTEEELDFIINYDIKYRMGKELKNGDEA